MTKMNVFDVSKAIIVRLVLLVHSILVTWVLTSTTQDKTYWTLSAACIGIVFEGIMTIYLNKAQEWTWFCPCFLFYMLSTIPAIWILELNRMERFIAKKAGINATLLEESQGLEEIQGVSIPINLPPDTWVSVMEQLFLYLMIVARWILPRGEISRDELSQLLFVFIGIASDIMELFALFEEDVVRENRTMMYTILSVWTVSLFQFTFVLTSTKSPKKTRVALHHEEESSRNQGCCNCMRAFFQTEIWSICVIIIMQDGPYLCVRMYTMVTFNLLTYSIVFFTAKNMLLVMLLFYRVTVLCRSHGKDEDDVEQPMEKDKSVKSFQENNSTTVQNGFKENSERPDIGDDMSTETQNKCLAPIATVENYQTSKHKVYDAGM